MGSIRFAGLEGRKVPGARWLYVCLLRRLSYNAFNNGKVFRSTREAAREIGADHRSVWIWFKELEYYGFIAMTEPGSKGPKRSSIALAHHRHGLG